MAHPYKTKSDRERARERYARGGQIEEQAHYTDSDIEANRLQRRAKVERDDSLVMDRRIHNPMGKSRREVSD